MASGDAVVQIIKVMPTATLAATIDYRAGGATPAEQVMVWDFDPSTVEYMDFLCKLEGYAGGGLTFTIPWSSDGATTGNAIVSIGIRRIQDDGEDIDDAHTYVYNNTTDATANVSGELSYPTIAFTDGADMDSWAEGELAIVRFRRFASDGNDTMNSNDLELWGILGLET